MGNNPIPPRHVTFEYNLPRNGSMTPLERLRDRYLRGRIDVERFLLELHYVLTGPVADQPGVAHTVGDDAPAPPPSPFHLRTGG